MPDISSDNSNNEPSSDSMTQTSKQPDLASSPSPSTTSTSSPAPDITPTLTAAGPQPPAASKSPTKPWWPAVIISVLVVAVALGASMAVRSHQNHQTATIKKDIPLLTYGTDAGGEVPDYPVTYLYANVDINIALQLFEGLVGYQGETKVVPLLATSWSNPNDNTWIFDIRHNVQFHTGRTMTAQDVAYSLNYALAHQNADGGDSTFLYATNDIKKVSVTGPYQVTVTTTSPDAVLLNQLGLIGIVDSKATPGDYDAGTGPYILKPGTKPTSSSIDLVAASNYWGGHVYTREVQIGAYTDPDKLISAVNDGKLDLAGFFTTGQIGQIKKTYQSINIPFQGLQYLGVNVNKPGSPLQSLAARQALAYALNIPAILKAGGQQGQQTSQIVPLILPGYNPAIQNTPYDPAKAKQLLVGAPNISTPITLAVPTQIASSQGQVMANDLTAVGFNVKLVDVADFGTLITNGIAGDYDLFTAGDSSAYVDGLDILIGLLENSQDYNNPQINNLLTQAGSTLNAANRISDMQQVASIVATDRPVIPLYSPIYVYTLTKPYVITPNLPDLDISTYFWQVYQH